MWKSFSEWNWWKDKRKKTFLSLSCCYLFIFCGFFLKKKKQMTSNVLGAVAHEFMWRRIIKLSSDNVLQNNGRKAFFCWYTDCHKCHLDTENTKTSLNSRKHAITVKSSIKYWKQNNIIPVRDITRGGEVAKGKNFKFYLTMDKNMCYKCGLSLSPSSLLCCCQIAIASTSKWKPFRS